MTFRLTAHAVAVGALALAGCAQVMPTLDRSAKPEPASAYIAGRFEHIRNSGFAFVLKDARDEQYVVTFGAGITGAGAVATGVVGMTAVPPGDYVVSGWKAYNRTTHENEVQKDLPPGNRVTTPFHVEPGQVVFIGSFEASSSTTVSYPTVHLYWEIRPRPLRADEVIEAIRGAYPAFAEAPVACVLCTAPREGATASATPPAAASPVFGMKRVAVHYHRWHGAYDGWGLHGWESFAPPRRGSRALVGVTWQTPLPPDEIDDFGACWKLAEANFGDGRVNFLLHQGETKDLGGMTRSWLLSDGMEAWVNEDDPQLYLSREAAEAAWPKTSTR